ncbi:hypothetical protein JJD41_19230 [Oxynema sp. CENA135]|uniref:hypothetical protein n=1 Tax=Oxynema sp. CENA135 TaxID=984206 RepID=UPI001909C084|nr:hypothetical protein [Oxynema sp. CENA135]MBK4731986.1 hypothetical protein [Oxynema sp. CENA135]
MRSPAIGFDGLPPEGDASLLDSMASVGDRATVESRSPLDPTPPTFSILTIAGGIFNLIEGLQEI